MSPVEQTMGQIAERLAELARQEIELCSCEQAINLRERLAIAARGTLAIHVVKESGSWTVELWRDGELKGIDGGVLTVAEAMDRVSGFIRRELPVNVTRNGDGA